MVIRESKFIYADKFRGFSNSYIPIRPVNFLVGENSTGKTSLLALIEKLSTNSFFSSTAETGSMEIFNSFDDSLSAGLPLSEDFTVGHFEKTVDEGGGQVDCGMVLLTFRNNSGRSELSRFSYTFEDTAIVTKVSNKFFSYKIFQIQSPLEKGAPGLNVFSECVKYHSTDEKGFKRVPFSRELPLASIPMLVLSSLRESIDEMSFRSFVEKVKIDSFDDNLTSMAPIRTNPMRAYYGTSPDYSPDGKHTPYAIRALKKSGATGRKFFSKLKGFGETSHLFEDINVTEYGKGPTDPFQLEAKLGDKQIRVSSVGYGVSQSIPVVVEIINSKPLSFVCVQQPEVHLHPKAQAAIGKLLFESWQNERKWFIVETHSDHLIDRFRLEMKKAELDSSMSTHVQILYFERSKAGNAAHSIFVSSEGALMGDQPKSYREFFIREQIDLLGL